MQMIDLNAKAVECERAIERVADPERRVVLESLRSLWIDLHNASLHVREPDPSGQIATIAELHTELMASCRAAMH